MRLGWGARTAHSSLWLAVMVLGMATTARAQEEPSSRVIKSLRKLGRGMANLATAPAELIRTPELVGRRDGYVAAMSVGLVHGLCRVFLRGLTGAFEVATFAVEIPRDYQPLMKPEFVWEHGNWSP